MVKRSIYKAYVIDQTEDGFYLSDGNGFILESEDLVEIGEGLIKFAKKHKRDILEHNERVKKELEDWINSQMSQEKRTKPKAKSYLYMMECENKYKIGVSKDVSRRKNELDNRPFPTRLICTSRLLEGAYGFEQELHNYLAEYSVGGEWYKFDEAKVEEIRAYINSL